MCRPARHNAITALCASGMVSSTRRQRLGWLRVWDLWVVNDVMVFLRWERRFSLHLSALEYIYIPAVFSPCDCNSSLTNSHSYSRIFDLSTRQPLWQRIRHNILLTNRVPFFSFQGTQLGVKVWRWLVGVRASIHQNEWHQKCKLIYRLSDFEWFFQYTELNFI